MCYESRNYVVLPTVFLASRGELKISIFKNLLNKNKERKRKRSKKYGKKGGRRLIFSKPD